MAWSIVVRAHQTLPTEGGFKPRNARGVGQPSWPVLPSSHRGTTPGQPGEGRTRDCSVKREARRTEQHTARPVRRMSVEIDRLSAPVYLAVWLIALVAASAASSTPAPGDTPAAPHETSMKLGCGSGPLAQLAMVVFGLNTDHPHYSWKIVTPLLFETYTRLFAGLTVTKFGYGGTGRTDTSFVFPSITMRLVDMESVT